MAEPTIDIERVVREVLQALSALQGTGGPATRGTAHAAAAVAPQPGASASGGDERKNAIDAGRLVIGERIVTLAQLDGQLAGIREIVVPPQAVVTPAVHDELARRDVKLSYAAADVQQPAGSTLRLVLVVTGTAFDPARLMAAVKGLSLLIVPHTLDCIMASCDLLAHQLGQAKTLGLLLTRHTAPGLCLANRLPGVRAVTAHDAATVRRAARSVGANLLVADPESTNIFTLKQMLMEFCRGGVRECPEVFRKRLNY